MAIMSDSTMWMNVKHCSRFLLPVVDGKINSDHLICLSGWAIPAPGIFRSSRLYGCAFTVWCYLSSCAQPSCHRVPKYISVNLCTECLHFTCGSGSHPHSKCPYRPWSRPSGRLYSPVLPPLHIILL